MTGEIPIPLDSEALVASALCMAEATPLSLLARTLPEGTAGEGYWDQLAQTDFVLHVKEVPAKQVVLAAQRGGAQQQFQGREQQEGISPHVSVSRMGIRGTSKRPCDDEDVKEEQQQQQLQPQQQQQLIPKRQYIAVAKVIPGIA